jgi:serine/threonine protein kinase
MTAITGSRTDATRTHTGRVFFVYQEPAAAGMHQYETLEKIGEGAYGIVYAAIFNGDAHVPSPGTKVAIKVFKGERHPRW